MDRLRIGLLCAVLLLASPGAAAEGEKTLRYRSNAFDLQTGRLVYIESHTERWQDGRHISSQVVYLNPNGEVFARKNVRFGASATAPDFRLEDARSGLVEEVKASGGGFRTLFIAAQGETEKTAVVRASPPVVVDAGFDRFVRDNFDSLRAGQRLTGQFIVPSRGMAFVCRLQKTGETTIGGRPALKLRMEPDNVVLRQLAAPIDIAYDMATRRLLSYSGQSNLEESPGGKMFRVRIVFNYPAEMLNP